MEKTYGTPFKSEMYDIGINPTHVQAFVDYPDKIVRVDQAFRFKFKDFIIGRKLLRELRDRYQVHIPHFEYVRGWDPESNSDTVYTIVDRVKGKSLWDIDHVEPPNVEHAREQFDMLCVNLTRYYHDKFLKGGLFLINWSSGDFMYGRTSGDNEDKLYLVDLDPRYAGQKSGLNSNDDRWIARRHLLNVNSLLLKLEKVLGGLKLNQARWEYANFIKNKYHIIKIMP